MQTVNRQYPLPHKNNVVLEDLERIRVAFSTIDADIVETEEKVDDTLYIVSDLENRAVHTSTVVENSEIQNIAPDCYLKTTNDGEGFECVEGGGDEGGKTGQNSIKKSDDNYDTIWGNVLEVSTKGMTIQQNAESSKPNEAHIFAEEIDETGEASRFPRVDLVNQQIAENVFAENNESFILKDEVEQISEKLQIATRKNYGLVKIGDGINDDSGKISIDEIGFASKENFGLVKIGDGLDENDGVLSREQIEIASSTTFGVVKLGEDFSLGTSNGIEVVETGDEEMVIYDLAKMKIVQNGIVDLEENIAIYRAFLNEDLQFSFNVDFEPESDFSFWLEIISDGEHIVDFVDLVPEKVSPLGVNRGITRIKFTKLLGASKLDAEVNILDAPEPILLTPNNGDHLKSDLILSCNGSTMDTYGMMGTDVGNITFQNNPREVYFDFAKSVVVDSVYFYNSNSNALSLFELLGSSDRITWTRLLYKTGVVIEKNTQTEKKGAYHYFKLRFSNEANVRGIQLWGSIIDNDDSELILLTPQMSAAIVAGITISCSNLRLNQLYNITAPTVTSCIELDKGTYDDPWIQYEFATPRVANFLDMSSHNDQLGRTARWFRLLASNDGEEWDLLLEREYQENWMQGETRYFNLENEMAYKFYRLICVYTSDSNNPFIWRISRFRLFRRESGTSSFVNCLPPLIAADQDGYEISANSEVDSGHVAVNAFDGNDDTKWATAAGDHLNSWLKIKLPEATAFNAAYLRTRGDGYYYQAPSVFKIQGSDDNETWIDLTYEPASWSQKEGKIFYWQNDTAYLYYRLLVESVQSGTNAGLAVFSLGTRAKTYRRYLKKYEYLIPAMTSNNTDGCVASASSEYSNGEGAWRAFDRTTAQWTTVNGTRVNVELKIQLPTAASCDFFSITGPNIASRGPSKFRIEGSSDALLWTILYEQNAPVGFGSNESRIFQNAYPNTQFMYYRLFVVENVSDGFLSVQEFGLIKESFVEEY